MIRSMRRWHARFSDEAAASAVEYALLAALIAAVIVVTVHAIGLKVNDLFDITF